MNQQQAIELLAPAIPRADERPVWADLGAGEGTFTRALAHLLGDGDIHAVERDGSAIPALEALARRLSAAKSSAPQARIHVVQGDFTEDVPITEADGFLLANALHYVPTEEQPAVLARLAMRLRPTGRVVLIEYDRHSANPWVPFPIPRAALEHLAHESGLRPPRVVSTAPSSFGPQMYCAVMAAAG